MMAWKITSVYQKIRYIAERTKKITSVYQKIRYFAVYSKFFYQSKSKNKLHDLMMRRNVASRRSVVSEINYMIWWWLEKLQVSTKKLGILLRQ